MKLLLILFCCGGCLLTWGTPVTGRELAARRAYCRFVLLEARPVLRPEESWSTDEGEIYKAEDALFKLLSFFEGQRTVDEVRSRLREDRSQLTVGQIVDLIPKSTGVSLREVKRARRRLQAAVASGTFEESLEDDERNPYFAHPVLGPITSGDVEGIKAVIQDLSSLGDASWNPGMVRGATRAALGKLVRNYQHFLPGRASMLPDLPGFTQTVVDVVVVRTLSNLMGGWRALGEAVSTEISRHEPHLFRSQAESDEEITTLLRMMFISQLTYPSSITSDDRPLINWIASHLSHSDRRDYGVRYAAALNLAAINFGDTQARLLRVAEAAQAELGEEGDEDAPIDVGVFLRAAVAVRAAEHGKSRPLDHLAPVFSEVLRLYAEEQSSIEPPANGRHPYYERIVQSLALKDDESTRLSRVLGGRLGCFHEYYSKVNAQLEELLSAADPSNTSDAE